MDDLTDQLKFHGIIEKEVLEIGYGQLNVNVVIKNGKPVIESIQIIKQKRIKYPIRKK